MFRHVIRINLILDGCDEISLMLLSPSPRRPSLPAQGDRSYLYGLRTFAMTTYSIGTPTRSKIFNVCFASFVIYSIILTYHHQSNLSNSPPGISLSLLPLSTSFLNTTLLPVQARHEHLTPLVTPYPTLTPEERESQFSRRERVAVCICGTIRTFYYKAVHTNIMNNIIDPLRKDYDTDVFFISRMEDDTGNTANPVFLNLEESKKAIDSFNPTEVIEYSGLEGVSGFDRERYVERNATTREAVKYKSPKHCGFKPRRTIHFSHTLYRTKHCIEAVQAYEVKHSKTYDWVYRIRPDVVMNQQISLPREMSRDTLYLTYSPWDVPFQNWWPNFTNNYFVGYGHVGDQMFVASRQVALVAFNAFDIADDCDLYKMPDFTIEASIRFYLVKYGIKYFLPKWIWLIVRGDYQPICLALKSIHVPNTTFEEREKFCLKFIKNSNGEVKGY